MLYVAFSLARSDGILSNHKLISLIPETALSHEQNRQPTCVAEGSESYRMSRLLYYILFMG